MENNFSIFVPFDTLEKGKDKDGKDIMIIGGVVSDELTGPDLDGEVIEVEGMDLTKFMTKGFVNYNHLASKDPSMIIGEPISFEKKNGKLFVKSMLYSDSDMAKKVYDLATTLSKNSSTRKMGYSIEGVAVERDSVNNKRIKKSSVSGLAVAPHPKCSGTALSIVKGVVGEYEVEEGSEFLIDVTDENGNRTTVDKNLNIEKAMVAGAITGRETNDQSLTQEPLKEESIAGVTKKKKKKKVIAADCCEPMTKGQVFLKLIDDHNLDLESCERIYNLMDGIEKGEDGEGLEKAEDLHYEYIDVHKNGIVFKRRQLVSGEEDKVDISKTGSRVKHQKFGHGTVTNYDNSGKITVNFDEHGEKSLLSQFAKLEPSDSNLKDFSTSKIDDKKPELAEPIQVKQKKEKVKREPSFVDVDLKIVHETDKAFRVSKDGKEIWIPKGWVGDTSGKQILSVKKQFSSRLNDSFNNVVESKPIVTDKMTIKKETEKAYLIGIRMIDPLDNSVNDSELWFPKSKVKIDGDKLSIDSDFFKQKENELYEKNSIMHVKPALNTEKAIGVHVSVYENMSEQTVGRTMWFPKSQLKEHDGKFIIPSWLYEAKVNDLYDSVKTGGWQYSSNNTFEIEGLNQFEKKYPEIIKANNIENYYNKQEN